ncbi:MAG: serine/threonine-protein kinase [Ktedonobacteraceae bacterium]
MQQSSMILFCDDCGAANEPGATYCVACHLSLTQTTGALSVPTRAVPVSLAQPMVREVVAGAAVMPTYSGLPLNLLPGTLLFGRYQIRQEIGRGGFSIVYLAEDLREHRKLVAIKRIYLRTLTPRQIIDATETCNREIKLLSFLQPVDGVPRLYESFTDTENWYLMMEYIQGQTLEEYMQKAPGGYLPESKVVEIGEKLVNLLEKLQIANHQVIFRDVKPANIMITPDGKLYLIDFGIARFFTPGQRKDTTPLGTPGYAPPEQYGRAQTDERADVYSLGMTLQTLLTGREPLELTHGELSCNPKAPSSRLRKLLNAMQDPEVSQRPATMKEIEKRLTWFKNVGDKKRVILSLCMGSVLGILFSGMLFWLFTGGWRFGQFAWIWILLLNVFNAKKGFKKLSQKFAKYFVWFGFGVVVSIAILLWIIQAFIPLP